LIINKTLFKKIAPF